MTLCHTLGNAQALVNTVAETVQDMEELSVGDTPGGAQALVDAQADTLGEVESVTPGDTLADARALNNLLGDISRHTKQCPVTGRHCG